MTDKRWRVDVLAENLRRRRSSFKVRKVTLMSMQFREHTSPETETLLDTSKPRLLLKITCFIFDRRVGGPHVAAAAIYARFVDHGHEVRIVLPSGHGNARDYFAANGLRVDQLRIVPPASPRRLGAFLKSIARLPISVLRVRHYLTQTQPDAIRVNGVLDVVPVISGWLAGVPVILYVNDTVFPPRFSRALARVVQPFVTRWVAAARRVGEHYGLDMERTPVVYEPVDTEQFAPRPPDGLPRPEPVLGLLANWNRIKGQERFIDVIRRLRTGGMALRGRVLGAFVETQEDYWRPLLAEMQREGLDKLIGCPGFVEDTSSAIRELDLLLLTSRSEACPLCVLEGMAVGVPVVAFDVGGVREILGTETQDPAGIVVAEGDVPSMVCAIRDLLSDTDRYRAMALAGPNRAARLFSLEECVRQHEELYAQVISARQQIDQ